MHLRHPVFYFTDKDGLKGGRWSVAAGIIEGDTPITPQTILDYDSLPSPENKEFVADPFFIEHNSRYYLFVEYFHNYKGVVAYYDSDDFKNWNFRGTVLEEKFHISYPQVFKDDDGEIYMLPEASKSKKVILYKAVSFPDKWERVSEILTGVKIVDPSLVKFGGHYYIFCIDDKRVQRVFVSNDLHKGWKEHNSSPLGIGVKKRPGGRIFEKDGSFFLPVQSSRTGYGSALNLMKIKMLSQDKIVVDKKLKRFLKPFPAVKYFYYGTHHVDIQKKEGRQFYVIDGRGKETKSIFVFDLRASIVKNALDVFDLLGVYKLPSGFY
jgi:hypothetical protein